MSNPITNTEELLQLNRQLLESIAEADWATYQKLSAPSLTAFEPEALGHLVLGLEFHHFYFELGGVKGESHTTMIAPHVRIMGDVAVVAYARLNQQLNANGVPVTTRFEETRVWQRQDGHWRQVHFHRSHA
jgi:calcium/calmodulin-dependent protein kinase (CaM kinase) II